METPRWSQDTADIAVLAFGRDVPDGGDLALVPVTLKDTAGAQRVIWDNGELSGCRRAVGLEDMRSSCRLPAGCAPSSPGPSSAAGQAVQTAPQTRTDPSLPFGVGRESLSPRGGNSTKGGLPSPIPPSRGLTSKAGHTCSCWNSKNTSTLVAQKRDMRSSLVQSFPSFEPFQLIIGTCK